MFLNECHQKLQLECQENMPAKKHRRRRTHSNSSNSSSDGESLSDDSCDRDFTPSDNEIVNEDDQINESPSEPHISLANSRPTTPPSSKNRNSQNKSDNSLTPYSTHIDSNIALAPTKLALPLSNTKHNNTNSNKSCGDCFHMTQFSRSCVGSSKYLMNAHLNVVSDDDLVFESRFESGNLAKAIKITPVYYELYLRPDLYTNKHTQWFYFRVTNVKKGFTYRYFLFYRQNIRKKMIKNITFM